MTHFAKDAIALVILGAVVLGGGSVAPSRPSAASGL